jgi:hypothetical protein
MERAAALVAKGYRPHQASAKDDFLKRWHAIRGVLGLGTRLARDVDSKYIRSFALARGNTSSSTAKKDMHTIRPILKAARAEGWIRDVPEFPRITNTRNPRLPFSAAEFRRLCETCQREEVRDFMLIVVLGLLRPYETWRLALADVEDGGDAMRVRVRRKTGLAHAPIPMRFPRLREALRRRCAAAGRDGRLFPYNAEWFPRQFSALLDATGLRQPLGASSRPRDSWSLLATGICLEIRRQRKAHGAADYLRIARWAGTSVSRIDAHYAAFLA